MITVLLVDDHELVRTGVRRILEDSGNFKVVGEATTGEEAVAWARGNKADVVLMDMVMPGINGLEATVKYLRVRPEARILVLSMRTEDPFPSKVMQAGAFGYLSKAASPDEMISAINTVAQGRKYLSQEIAQQMALSSFDAKENENPFKELSERELQITLLITKGMKAAGIAEKLCLSPKTVNSYRYRIFEKLHISGDVELTRLAIRYNIVSE
ncbi:MAG: UvrY/SirA/GacA family response regulator transcription factor [Succinivibrionaceae bacterium]|nr:UvrY/SirA/GacA family response regulator transcription factor [Succinivibrionaceae bacterium]